MTKSSQNCLVLDIGKTNIKIHVLNEKQRTLVLHTKDNEIRKKPPYPHADVDGIWKWIMEVVSICANEFEIGAIAVSAHGATTALVNSSLNGNGLALPIMDYEWRGLDINDSAYEKIRPPFQETYSPSLPGGLNIGRQLVWQQKYFPDEFQNVDALLMYPQYWSWRLTGRLVSEVSSLGCHTDLWAPEVNNYSSLVTSQDWTHLLPPLASAWDSLGTISEEVATKTGLPTSCRVHAGVHDSNASFLRFLLAKRDEEFCVVSSGTWVVCMSNKSSLDCLDPAKDMLANVDVEGHPVPCIRFMGGREYAKICSITGSDTDQHMTEEDIAQIVTSGVMALPNFSNGSGPFGDRIAEIRGNPHNGAALATLYCALMVYHSLEKLRVRGDVIIVGSYLQNPLLCGLIAQLCWDQDIYLSSDQAGTVRGAAQLTDWSKPVSVLLKHCKPSQVAGLHAYRSWWQKEIGDYL